MALQLCEYSSLRRFTSLAGWLLLIAAALLAVCYFFLQGPKQKSVNWCAADPTLVMAPVPSMLRRASSIAVPIFAQFSVL